MAFILGFIFGAAVTLFLVYRKRHPKSIKSVRKDLNKNNSYEEDF